MQQETDEYSQSKGWRTNAILAAIVLGGGSALWLADFIDMRQREQKAAERVLLSHVTDRPVQQFRFRGADGSEVTLERQQEAWQIMEPQPLRTDTQAVQRLVAVLEQRYDRLVAEGSAADEPGELAPFGLEKPQAVLTVTRRGTPATGKAQSATGPAEPPWSLRLGDVVPASDGRYVQLGEKGPVVTIGRAQISMLLQNAGELRDTHLVPVGGTGEVSADRGEAVMAVSLHRQTDSVEMQRDGQTLMWKLMRPWEDQLEGARVHRWLDMLLSYRGRRFLRDVAVPDAPAWRLQLTWKDQRQETIPIWWHDGDLLAKRSDDPDVMVLDAYLTEELNRKPLELVRLRALSEDIDVEELELLWQDQRQHAARPPAAVPPSAVPPSAATLTTETPARGPWPLAAWSTLEEVLTRPAQEAQRAPSSAGEVPPEMVHHEPPLFRIRVNTRPELEFAFWKEEERYRIGLPDRPVQVRLSRVQSAGLDDALRALGVKLDLPVPGSGDQGGEAAAPPQ
jgi:hypothetical protein